MNAAEAEQSAVHRGHLWRVEIFDAQLGGSIYLYYATEEGAYQASHRAGGWVHHYDGETWVNSVPGFVPGGREKGEEEES